MRRSSSEQLPRSPKDDPIQRRGRHDPRAGDGLLDRKPALDGLAHVAQREPEPQPPLGRARVEHARRRGDSEAGGEIDRVLRAPERVVVPRLRPIAGREPCGQLRRRSEEHTSELQSPCNLVCRLLLEKKKTYKATTIC